MLLIYRPSDRASQGPGHTGSFFEFVFILTNREFHCVPCGKIKQKARLGFLKLDAFLSPDKENHQEYIVYCGLLEKKHMGKASRLARPLDNKNTAP